MLARRLAVPVAVALLAFPARAQERQTPLAPTPGQGKLSIETPEFSIRVRGYLQADDRHVFGDGPWSDALLIRRARAVLEGAAFGRVEVKIMADFAASPMLYDAYVDGKLTPWLRLRFGKDKVPISLERLRSARDQLFGERAQPGVFAPVREIGAQILAAPWDGRLAASFGVMQAAPDGVNPDIFGSDGGGDDKDVIGRVFVRPFPRGALRELGLGISGSLGSATGSATTPRLPTYKTTAQLSYFSYRPEAVAFDQRAHLGVQLHCAAGPVELMAEAVESVEGVKVGDQVGRFANGAYSIELAFLPTGEHASFEGVLPRKPFDPTHGRFGALMVAVRQQGTRFDRRAFPVFADPQTAAAGALGVGASLTWIWNGIFQLQSSWETTTFDGKRRDEHVLVTRAQAAF
ncbi:MAG TPA: porin [Polyangiaceae bacterium]|jgi:phosphate-selective porin OprO/OprP